MRSPGNLVPLLIKWLAFCHSSALSHSYCVHQGVMKLAYADTLPNVVSGLTALLVVMGVDSLLLVLSYTLILPTVLGLASPRESIRVLNTCVSHILAIFVFFIPGITMSMIHHFGRHLPPIVHALVAYVYLLVPPVLNPIIYSVKSKPIREAMLRVLRGKGQS
ncbi:olfactory receptor 51E2-like [Physeter macrocephalus]|uniref:Olfactory receptor 51E2-like n=1 Tax=Physeter macrocephalus TaxID=9755 RepID=A0A9W2X7G6_PHYMC|nr:olfactory receptor 51E2-like [Physeter catodon]